MKRLCTVVDVVTARKILITSFNIPEAYITTVTVEVSIPDKECSIHRVLDSSIIQGSNHFCLRNNLPLSINILFVRKILSKHSRSSISIKIWSVTDGEYRPIGLNGEVLWISVIHVVAFKIIGSSTIAGTRLHRIGSIFQFCECHIIGRGNQ